jgi:hypothetical protein
MFFASSTSRMARKNLINRIPDTPSSMKKGKNFQRCRVASNHEAFGLPTNVHPHHPSNAADTNNPIPTPTSNATPTATAVATTTAAVAAPTAAIAPASTNPTAARPVVPNTMPAPWTRVKPPISGNHPLKIAGTLRRRWPRRAHC